MGYNYTRRSSDIPLFHTPPVPPAFSVFIFRDDFDAQAMATRHGGVHLQLQEETVLALARKLVLHWLFGAVCQLQGS